MNTLKNLASLAATVVLVAGCATQPAAPPASSGAWSPAQYGRVQSIDTLLVDGRSSGAGAVLGGVVGGLLGHQVGKGSGKDAATVVGAVGGAVIGDRIEKRRVGEREIYRVSVRLYRGGVRSFDYEQIGDLRVGDRVRIDNDQLVLDYNRHP